mmetsp:Transcript_15027/g.25841  ORF Transcript_15027/g.25841 Transcript_15027/m.25841 type:complete len:490 (+) Transcript_15027:6-1475(+)
MSDLPPLSPPPPPTPPEPIDEPIAAPLSPHEKTGPLSPPPPPSQQEQLAALKAERKLIKVEILKLAGLPQSFETDEKIKANGAKLKALEQQINVIKAGSTSPKVIKKAPPKRTEAVKNIMALRQSSERSSSNSTPKSSPPIHSPISSPHSLRAESRVLHADEDAQSREAYSSLSQKLSDSTRAAPIMPPSPILELSDIIEDDEVEAPPEPEEEPVNRALQLTQPRRTRRGSEAVTPSNLAVGSVSTNQFDISGTYYEISQVCYGGINVGRRWIDPTARHRPTERCWHELRLGTNVDTMSDVGQGVLRLLDRYFLEKPGRYRYKPGETSHEWDSHGPCPDGIPAKLLAQLCLEACKVLKNDAPLVRMSQPTYVLGDLHGNYKDLTLFARGFFPLGIDLCPANLLFLGDYVDRGPHSIEVAAFVLATKLVQPNRVFTLRGNHEISDLNGNVKAYGKSCFKGQLQYVYGEKKGHKLWLAFNEVFRFMPIDEN